MPAMDTKPLAHAKTPLAMDITMLAIAIKPLAHDKIPLAMDKMMLRGCKIIVGV